MDQPESLLDWALWSARRGFRVFPCEAGGRHPLVDRFYDRATTDESIIRRWWAARPGANPAISTDDLIVLDADVKNGKVGLETLASLDLPETFTVDTPSGGRHAYFRGDGRNSVERLGPGLDVRGFHGFVLAPGACTGAGMYRLRDVVDLVEAPTTLSIFPADRNSSAGIGHTDDSDANLARGEAYLQSEAPLAIGGLGGDQTTFKVAATLKDFGVSEYAAWTLMEEHWNDRCQPPWSLEMLETKVANAYRYGLRAPGAESPEVNFAGVAIDPPGRQGWSWSYHGEPPVLDGDWLLHETLPSVGTLLVVGPSMGGKTFLLTDLARAVASQTAFFDVIPEEKGAVLMVFAGTEGAGIQNRLAAAGPAEPRLPIAYTDGVYLRQKAAQQQFAEEIEAQARTMLEHFGVPLRVLVLETISASGLVEKENDSDSVALALAALGQIAKKLGILVATSHHPPKNDDGPRGSGAFTANVDSVIEVIREDMAPVRLVHLRKARNAMSRTLGSFTLAPVELGQDAKGRPVISMKLTSSTSVMPKLSEDYAARLVEALAADAQRYGHLLADGRKGLPPTELKTAFAEAVPFLAKDKQPSALRRALIDAQDKGAVEIVREDGRDFYVVKEIKL